MSYTDKVFEMLGAEPYEEFYLIDTYTGKKNELKYYFTPTLKISFKDETQSEATSCLSISDIITEIVKIKKIKKYTDDEIKLAEFYKWLGYKYISKNSDDSLIVSKNRPEKICGVWVSLNKRLCLPKEDASKIKTPNILWEDDEPILIDDILNSAK